MSDIWVTLMDLHIAYVDRLALEHTTHWVSVGAKPTNGQPLDARLRYLSTRAGYRAEAAVRLWLGRTVPWTINKYVPHQPDFAGFIDVKGRTQLHHQLPITPECPSEYAYLLVCGAEHPHYRIVSWCWGYEGKQDRYWRDYGKGRPAWWVPEGSEIMKAPTLLQNLVPSTGLHTRSSGVTIS